MKEILRTWPECESRAGAWKSRRRRRRETCARTSSIMMRPVAHVRVRLTKSWTMAESEKLLSCTCRAAAEGVVVHAHARQP